MGVISDWFALMPRVEFANNHVVEEDVQYNDKLTNEKKSFRLRQQFGVLISRGERTGLEMIREVAVALPRDQVQGYPAGTYVLSGNCLIVTDRGRLQFSRDVSLVNVPQSILQLLEQDLKRAA